MGRAAGRQDLPALPEYLPYYSSLADERKFHVVPLFLTLSV